MTTNCVLLFTLHLCPRVNVSEADTRTMLTQFRQLDTQKRCETIIRQITTQSTTLFQFDHCLLIDVLQRGTVKYKLEWLTRLPPRSCP